AHVDPAFAKYQLILLCREWFQHANGALPAYEWDFGDVNPPVQAWAALEVFAIDGGRDLDFLPRVFDKLLVNFTWWVNLEDAGGNNLFEGGFLGLDNIGPIDRSHLPVGGILEQSDATGWMAFYAIAMAGIAAVLQRSGRRPAIDLVLKFLEHFAAITDAMDSQGLWNEADGLYYDRLLTPDGTAVPVKVRSMVGIIPMLTAAVIDEGMLHQCLVVGKRFADLLGRQGMRDGDKLREAGLLRGEPGDQRLLLSVVSVARLEKLFAKLFDKNEFLSPYGLRALSAYHREHPYQLDVEGFRATIDYEPAESTTAMFGGNSNWRGPLWFPLNYLVVSVLERYYRFFGDELTFEYPAGSAHRVPLDLIAADLQDRLISIFVTGPDGRRPCFGWADRLQHDPAWKDNLVFNEYFHGDNGAGLGAAHQTGWTGLIADVIRRRHGAVSSVGDVIHSHYPQARPWYEPSLHVRFQIMARAAAGPSGDPGGARAVGRAGQDGGGYVASATRSGAWTGTWCVVLGSISTRHGDGPATEPERTLSRFRRSKDVRPAAVGSGAVHEPEVVRPGAGRWSWTSRSWRRCRRERDKVGRLRGERHRVQYPAEAGVPAVKVAGELVVQDAGADLEQEVGTGGCPAHLLFLDHALADDLVDRGLGERGGDGLASTAALPVVRDPPGVGADVAVELADRPEQPGLLRAGLGGVEADEDVVDDLQGAEDVAVPAEPLQPLQLRAELAGEVGRRRVHRGLRAR
ncbi:MAG TPA: hypothetical protein VEH31_07225, partial [Streptosporangiaceae bacterium]|nr:hypothetical protein [Streptosporangiaceae bacterium]